MASVALDPATVAVLEEHRTRAAEHGHRVTGRREPRDLHRAGLSEAGGLHFTFADLVERIRKASGWR
jgi:hypothetical protein